MLRFQRETSYWVNIVSMTISESSQNSSKPSAARRPRGVAWLWWPVACSKLAILLPLLAATLLTLEFITIPRKPLSLDPDSSWAAALTYAHQAGLQFGPDCSFTYGPLGYLTVPFYAGLPVGLRFGVDVAFCFVVAAGLCLMAWRIGVVWGTLLLLVFALFAANLHSGPDLLFDMGVLCWGLLCVLDEGKKLYGRLAVFLLLAAFACLVKINFLATAGLTVGVVAFDLALRRHQWLGAGVLVAFAGLFLLGWWGAGQRVENLPVFLSRSYQLAQGYDQTMGKEAAPAVLASGALTLLLGLACIGLRAANAYERPGSIGAWRAATLAVWLSALTFLTWKHGFVRVDAIHVELFLGFVAVLALALDALPARRRALFWSSRVLALGCCVSALLTWERFFYPGYLEQCAFDAFERPLGNLSTLTHPREYGRQMTEELDRERKAAELPRIRRLVGATPVDVYGNSQASAWLNGLGYTPRPALQSYAAADARIQDWNERFYESADAPHLVLAGLDPIDHRLPALEDSRLLLRLISDYALVQEENKMLLLERVSRATPQLCLASQGIARLGKPIPLECGPGEGLWLEVRLDRTLRGKARKFFYKDAELRLRVLDQCPTGGETGRDSCPANEFRAPAPMLAAGLLVSPLLLDTRDFSNLYGGKDLRRPAAISIQCAAGTEGCWEKGIYFRLYRIERFRNGADQPLINANQTLIEEEMCSNSSGKSR